MHILHKNHQNEGITPSHILQNDFLHEYILYGDSGNVFIKKVYVHIDEQNLYKICTPHKMSGFLSFTPFGSRYNVIKGAQEAVKNRIRQEARPLGWISRTFQMKLSWDFCLKHVRNWYNFAGFLGSTNVQFPVIFS